MMRFLAGAIIGVAIMLAIIHMDFFPYRLVPVATIESLKQQVADLTASPAPVAAATPRPGAWMWDPAYRTALEKTTIIGVPERSGRREH